MVAALRTAFPSAKLIAAGRKAEVAGTDGSLHLDLDAPDTLADAIAAVCPDTIIHLAAQADIARAFREPFSTWKTNVLGTIALGEAVLRVAPKARFIFASSGEVYGLTSQTGRNLNEGALLAPANPYAASKAAADLAIGEMVCRGLRATRMRAFTHIGPGQAPSFAIAAFARQVVRIEAGLQEPILHVGALDRWRDFLDVRDVCAAYVAAIRTDPSEGLFNICSGAARRIGDVLEDLLELAGVSVHLEVNPSLLRPTDLIRIEGDPSRAHRDLGWFPTQPWEETMRSVLDYWRRHEEK
jgi:GDP-4-dehydro-6-deoxy-D-mannose reductase